MSEIDGRLPRPQRIATGRTARADGRYWRLERSHPEERGSWAPIEDAAARRQAAAEYWGPRFALGLVALSVALWAAAAAAGALQGAVAIPLAYLADAAMALAVVAGVVGYTLSRPALPKPADPEIWPGFRPDAVDEIAKRIQATP